MQKAKHSARREYHTCCVPNCTIPLSIDHTITHGGQLARARANGCWTLRSRSKGSRARTNKSNEWQSNACAKCVNLIRRSVCCCRRCRHRRSMFMAIGEWNEWRKWIKSLIWRSIWTIHNFLHFHARHTWCFTSCAQSQMPSDIMKCGNFPSPSLPSKWQIGLRFRSESHYAMKHICENTI